MVLIVLAAVMVVACMAYRVRQTEHALRAEEARLLRVHHADVDPRTPVGD